MSTIGLNEGPFLIMTITYDNSVFTIADTVENKVPTITLSLADTINLAENFSKLRPDTKPTEEEITIWGAQHICKANSALVSSATKRLSADIAKYIERSFNDSIGTLIPDEVVLQDQIVIKAKVWGCEYTITLKAFIDDDQWSTVRTFMEIHNGEFAVKGLFTKDADAFFQWVLDDLTHANDHGHLD